VTAPAVRLDWGPAGAAGLGPACAVLVVVDVLSFSTSVEIAVGRGMRVYPLPWGEPAEEYAARLGATAAIGRSAVTPERPWSLSPATLSTAPVVPDLVLPSPNGSAICFAAVPTGACIVTACVRNAPAVAQWLLRHGYGTPRAPVGIVAAGERWPDGALRPCLEDMLGAVLLLEGLSYVEDRLPPGAVPALIRGSVSGRELVAQGFGRDVDLAVEVAVSAVVPVLAGGAFEDLANR